jgi:hypothetical protein
MASARSCYDQALCLRQRSLVARKGWACLVAASVRLLRIQRTDALLRSRLALRPITYAGPDDPAAAEFDQLSSVSYAATEPPRPSSFLFDPPARLGSSLPSRGEAMAQLLAAGVGKDTLMRATWSSFANRLCLFSIGRAKGQLLLARICSQRAQSNLSPAPPGKWKPTLRLAF